MPNILSKAINDVQGESMNVASLELCKELYELSGWSSDLSYIQYRDSETWEPILGWEIYKTNLLPSKGTTAYESVFAYDLGYLLRKLPKEIIVDGGNYRLIMQYAGDELRAHYWNNVLKKRALSTNYDGGLLGGFGKTEPEDSLAELAIELFKQGVLVKEDQGSTIMTSQKTYIVICPVDGKPAPWVENKEKYGRNYGKSYMAYYCKEHDTYVGCHQNTRQPLGTMADDELRKLRMAVHAKIDPLWRSGQHARKEVYKYLSKTLGYQFHTGESTKETCRQVLDLEIVL